MPHSFADVFGIADAVAVRYLPPPPKRGVEPGVVIAIVFVVLMFGECKLALIIGLLGLACLLA